MVEVGDLVSEHHYPSKGKTKLAAIPLVEFCGQRALRVRQYGRGRSKHYSQTVVMVMPTLDYYGSTEPTRRRGCRRRRIISCEGNRVVDKGLSYLIVVRLEPPGDEAADGFALNGRFP